jgi:ABC-type transport system involved in multi-copper enzyme maturation permease subunit
MTPPSLQDGAQPPDVAKARPLGSGTAEGGLAFARVKQAWTIARIELRRAFFARRSLWVYALALLPSVIFFFHGLEAKVRSERFARRSQIPAALMDSVRNGESADDIKARLGKPAEERWSTRSQRVRQQSGNAGTTTHLIEPVETRFVRLNITRPTYSGEPLARIYEFEVYGPEGTTNLALKRRATGSIPCSPDQGPENAVNGSVSGGQTDRWCSYDRPLFLQVDLGTARPVNRFIVKHASTGGENEDADSAEFNIQASDDGKTFRTVASSTGGGFVEQRTEFRRIIYFDGGREAQLQFTDGKLMFSNVRRVLDFEEDRTIFAAIFQHFYLRLAIFFGCLGIFMYLFRGEMSNRTLHFWFLAPARRDVLLAGKYAAGLIASTVIFGGGALLAVAAMMWPHDAVEVQTYWSSGGLGQMFWYAAAAALGCVGYGSVFLAVGLYVRNPIVPAALLIAWEGVNGVLPHALQKMSILYYLQSLCPVPAPVDANAPMLVRLLAAPAAPASRPGAILGLLLLTAFVLWVASFAVRRMQITYGAET